MAKERNFLVHVEADGKEYALYARTFEAADRAYDRVMRKLEALKPTELPALLTVSMSNVGGANFTHHYAEAFHGKWMVSKKNWTWDEWLDW